MKYLMLMVLGVMLGGCSGSSGSGQITVSGVAATGAAINGTVFLKDAAGHELSQVTGNGVYHFDVAGLRAPFILKAEWLDSQNIRQTLFSLATTDGTTNINPLTNLIVADAAGTPDPAQLYDNGTAAELSAAASHLPGSTTTLRNRLKPLLANYPGADVNPLTAPFTADHAGLDNLLDNLSVQIKGGVATIKDKDGTLLLSSPAAALSAGIASLSWNAQDAAKAYDPQVAVDTTGNAIVVWAQLSGTRFDIYAKRSTQAGWDLPVMISDGLGSASFPVIRMDGSGNAITAWYQWDGVRSTIWTARYTASGGWSRPVLISDGIGEANYPQLAVNAQGAAVVSWHQFRPADSSVTDVWVSRFTVGEGWSTAEIISDPAASSYRPQVALDSSGNATVIWFAGGNFTSSLWGARAAVASTWSGAVRISTPGTYAFSQAGLGMDSVGNVLVLWCQGVGSSTPAGLYTARHATGSSWQAPVLLAETEANYLFPSLAVNAAGNAVAAWKQTDGISAYTAWTATYNSSSWSAPLQISNGSGDVGYPHAGLDSAGNALVAWTEFEGTHYTIRTSSRLSGHSWGAAEVIFSDLSLNAYSSDFFPSHLAMNDSGSAMVVWGITSQ